MQVSTTSPCQSGLQHDLPCHLCQPQQAASLRCEAQEPWVVLGKGLVRFGMEAAVARCTSVLAGWPEARAGASRLAKTHGPGTSCRLHQDGGPGHFEGSG